MPETVEEKLKRRGDKMFDYNVDEILLTIVSDYGKKTLPNIEEVLYCDIVNAVLEYLTGEEKKLGLFHDFFNVPWELKANRLLEENFGKFGDKLNPKLKESLTHMLEQRNHCEHGESWHSSSFEDWMKFWPRPITSTLDLTVQFVEEVKKTLSLLEEDLRTQCEVIGKLMQKYVDEDVEYIRTHYHW